MKFKLKDGFLMGTASASAQIEGGEVGNCWNDFYHRGLIHDNTNPAVADDHYARYKEDTMLMSEMGLQIARIGVEWARLVPEEGKINQEAIDHYRDEIKGLLNLGIKPLLTIHHFSNPMWFENKGAFLKRENLHYYMELTELCVKSFGDLVSDYITINEPNVYASNGYAFGLFPPAHTSYPETFKVLENMAHCHIEAYKMIHAMRREMGYTDTKVGFANHLRVFDPKDPASRTQRAATKLAEWMFQGAITYAMARGEFKLPLVDHWKTKRGEYADFTGINYYTRSTIEGMADGVKENSPRNDLDWEIYPEGIVRVATWASRILYRPIYITENGTADTNDAFRSKYLYEHLKALSESVLPFERYYHWCFIDNWEWLEGQSARFGIVHNDYDTQIRTIKNSGKFFTEIIENKGVTDEMYEKFVAPQEYNVR